MPSLPCLRREYEHVLAQVRGFVGTCFTPIWSVEMSRIRMLWKYLETKLKFIGPIR